MKRKAGPPLVVAVALCAMFAMLLALTAPDPAWAVLNAVGPTDLENGFPLWYQDENDLALGQCLESNRFCELPLPGEQFGFNPLNPIVFPGNFPLEFSYFLAEAFVPPVIVGSALKRYEVGLEGGFLNEAVIDGEQVVFPFIRMRVDIATAGNYRIIHPYGEEIFPNQLAGSSIRVDPLELGITATPLDFAAALTGEFNCPVSICSPATTFGPFLVSNDPLNRDVVDPVTGNLYLTNPLTPVTVTGSPNNTNVVRVERVELDVQGNVTNVLEVVDETDLFFLFGKKSAIFEVAPRSITFPEQNIAPVFADRTVTLTNSSTAVTPRIGVISVSGTNATDFTVPPGDDGCSNQNLNGGASCTFVVRFRGVADGPARTATITIPRAAAGFTTETVAVSGAIDSVPPAVAAVFPLNNGPAAANMRIVAQFDDNLNPDTINVTTFTVATPGGPVAGEVSYDDASRIAVFTPAGLLAEGIVHTARIAGAPGGVADSVDNLLQADFTWSFTGAPPDFTPPTVTATNPPGGSGGFPTVAPLTVTFDEPMLSFTINPVTIRLATAAGPVAGTVAFDLASNTAVFTPLNPLGFGTEHTLTVTGAQDFAGNVVPDLTATFVSNFRPPAPAILAPLNGTSGVARPVTLRWTLPVDPDGDPLQFRVSICNNASFIGSGSDCQQNITVLASAQGSREVQYAGLGLLGMAFGLGGAFMAGGRKRRRLMMTAILAATLIAGMSFYSCGGGGGGGAVGAVGDDDGTLSPIAQEGVSTQVSGLSGGVTFFWKVESDDGKGGTSVSDVFTFSTQ